MEYKGLFNLIYNQANSIIIRPFLLNTYITLFKMYKVSTYFSCKQFAYQQNSHKITRSWGSYLHGKCFLFLKHP